MKFMFLERQTELLLAVLMNTAAANICEAIIHSILSINNWGRSKKQKIVKKL